jgi:hypothetical protein
MVTNNDKQATKYRHMKAQLNIKNTIRVLKVINIDHVQRSIDKIIIPCNVHACKKSGSNNRG